MQVCRGGNSGWWPLDQGDIATEVSRSCYMMIVITISGSGWFCPTSGRTPLGVLRPWVVSFQPSPLHSLPCDNPPGPAWQPAHTGAKAANNQTHINWSGRATLPAAGTSVMFFLLEPGCESLTTINFYSVSFSSNITLPILTPETVLNSMSTIKPV